MALSPIERDLKVEVAAQDSDLRALFELQILGVTSAVEQRRAAIIEDYDPSEIQQLHDDIRRDYALSETEFRKAIGMCVADIVGVSVGMPL